MIIILAALGLVVVKALGESPWGTFTVAVTIPTAMLMGVYMRSIRPGKVGEASAFGVIVLLLAIWYGQYVADARARASFHWRACAGFQQSSSTAPSPLCWCGSSSLLAITSARSSRSASLSRSRSAFIWSARSEDGGGDPLHRR